MTKLPPIVRQRLAATAPADHPAADLLNAFAERRLAAPERDRVLTHLSACAECRHIVALATSEESSLQPVFTPARSWWSIRSYQYGAVAALLAVVAIGLIVLRPEARQEMRQVASAPTLPKAPAGDGYVANEARPALGRETPESALKKEQKNDRADLTRERAFAGGAVVVQKPTAQPPKELDKLADAGKNEFRLDREIPKRDRDTVYFNATNDSFTAAPGAVVAQSPSKPPAKGAQITDQQSKTAAASETVEVTSEAASAVAPAKAATMPGAAPAANAPAVARAPAPVAGTTPVRSEAAKGLAAAQAVDVTGANPAADTQSADSADSRLEETSNRRVRIAAMAAAAAKDEQAKRKALASDPNYNARSVMWRINSGRLQKFDAARNVYDDMTVSGTARPSVVGSLGAEVWVGGTDGALYYSNDQGAHWIPVRTGAWSKDATFVGLTPTALRSVEVYLSNGERWRSADGGASWSKYQ
jgi:hypothetical protein